MSTALLPGLERILFTEEQIDQRIRDVPLKSPATTRER
jgi:hypothetical protein